MFNQAKPAFKFVIRSKIEDKAEPSKPEEIEKKEEPTPQTKVSPVVPTEDNSKKRKRPDKETVAAPIATKKVYSQLERWNKKKQELKQESDSLAEQEMAKAEYADLSSLACLLCQRKFKSKSDIERHQALSELHKNNLKDPVAVNKAKLKIQFIQKEQENKEVQSPAAEYRNRAAERRQAYGQPDKPVLSPPSSPPRRHVPSSREMASVPQASMYKPISDDNKGARMLAQMGWKKGEGLGRDGSGILDPVKAESYAQSAGIGSSVKRDVGGGSYQSRTFDTARKRLLGDR